jgi:hypothetical protein
MRASLRGDNKPSSFHFGLRGLCRARLIANSPLTRQPNAPAHHLLPRSRSIVMAGGSTVVAYFRSQSPLDYEFATHSP